ncbi:hypothetical protein AZOA_32180 [Azoarcus sp. Aa7]|nr:hypothetical protein [Azoarcus sp. Aa7]
MKDTQLIVQNGRTRREWKSPYAAIEIPDAASIPAQSVPEPTPPTRAAFRVGDCVTFEDRHLQTRIGTFVRISQSTATLDCDGQRWCVSFPLLRHLVDLCPHC